MSFRSNSGFRRRPLVRPVRDGAAGQRIRNSVKLAMSCGCVESVLFVTKRSG